MSWRRARTDGCESKSRISESHKNQNRARLTDSALAGNERPDFSKKDPLYFEPFLLDNDEQRTDDAPPPLPSNTGDEGGNQPPPLPGFG